MEFDDPRIADMETRLRNDMRTTLLRNGMGPADETWIEAMLDELVGDAMFVVEKVIDGGL